MIMANMNSSLLSIGSNSSSKFSTRLTSSKKPVRRTGFQSYGTNLFSLTALVAILLQQAASNLTIEAAKARGIIYNRGGKFIYRTPKSSQAHIIVIDDRRRDNGATDVATTKDEPTAKGTDQSAEAAGQTNPVRQAQLGQVKQISLASPIAEQQLYQPTIRLISQRSYQPHDAQLTANLITRNSHLFPTDSQPIQLVSLNDLAGQLPVARPTAGQSGQQLSSLDAGRQQTAATVNYLDNGGMVHALRAAPSLVPVVQLYQPAALSQSQPIRPPDLMAYDYQSAAPRQTQFIELDERLLPATQSAQRFLTPSSAAGPLAHQSHSNFLAHPTPRLSNIDSEAGGDFSLGLEPADAGMNEDGPTLLYGQMSPHHRQSMEPLPMLRSARSKFDHSPEDMADPQVFEPIDDRPRSILHSEMSPRHEPKTSGRLKGGASDDHPEPRSKSYKRASRTHKMRTAASYSEPDLQRVHNDSRYWRQYKDQYEII